MEQVAQSLVWMCWALVLAFTHYIGYVERKRLHRLIDAQNRLLKRQHEIVNARESWRHSVASFLGMLRETAPEPIRTVAAQLIPPDMNIVAVVGSVEKPKDPAAKDPVH